MNTHNIRIFGSVQRYVQGPGAIDLVGGLCAGLGTKALVLTDSGVRPLISGPLAQSCAAQGVAVEFLCCDNGVTPAAVEECVRQASSSGIAHEVVIAAGGGKAVDLGKAISRELETKLVVLPTAASNDGPCSQFFVYYDDAHRLLSAERLPRHPDAVVMDTAILVKAPRALLVAGIGDALAKRYEGRQHAKANAVNMLGGARTMAATYLAAACDDVLRSNALAGLAALDRGVPNEAFERLVEALVLFSGLAFENGGLSIAHSMTRGLPLLDGVGRSLHGMQVAYGLLVQFVLERRDDGFLADMVGFYGAVGLPTNLRALGFAPRDEKALHAGIEAAAAATMKAPHIVNFERPLRAQELADAMRSLERRATACTVH